MPLINPRVLEAALGSPEAIPNEHLSLVTHWAESIRDGSIRGQNETQLEGDFKNRIVEQILGYRSFGSGHPQTVKAKVLMGTGEVDLALGHFDAVPLEIVAPFELKGARTVDLDAPMPGRKISPVQQAWNYANAVKGVRWVLVSNLLEMRLYAFGEGNQDYEFIDLARIDEPKEYAKLVLLFSAGNLLGGATTELLKRSKDAEEDVSKRLYLDYKKLRETLIASVDAATGSKDRVSAINTAQKILDRVLFVAFAEDTALLPGKLLETTCKHRDPYHPRPTWHNFKSLFRAIDEGSKPLQIPRYNGGLFRADPQIDTLELPDEMCSGFMALGAYNFASEVSVTVLGHIFEQSVTDVERLLAEARGEEQEEERTLGTTGRRKRDGIVYTPDYIARFIVERTLGVHVDALFRSVMAKHAKGGDASDYDSLRFNARKGTGAWTKQELAAWMDYQAQLRSLRVVDPACGSGVFLVTAFDFLRAEYDRVNKKLGELRGSGSQLDALDIDREILSQNLYGVDVNEESVEITKLSLWIKTARRGKVLDSLDHTIRIGDSLIEDTNFAYLKHGFEWKKAFPEVFAVGGFDVVIGNPPYVRMELIKSMKPYLESRFEVVSDRADLYCYFYERGLRLLKPGGRLGFISSSTFFKTGSGAPLRSYLLKEAAIETVTDFGDLQVFAGVTTYPAILTMTKTAVPSDHAIAFLKLDALPGGSFSALFEERSRPFSQAKLGTGSWELEDTALWALREKLVSGKPTLKDRFGSPQRGIVTGLNEAFVVDRETRDGLILDDPKSANLLKPFLEGRDLKRWHAEPRDLWIIYIPKGTVDIRDYPAIEKHLASFKGQLEDRATKQEWFELQQAQAAYIPSFEGSKISYPHFNAERLFHLEATGAYSNDKSYLIPTADRKLLAYLNSTVAWFLLSGLSPPVRGGYHELRVQYVETLPIPADLDKAVRLEELASRCEQSAADIYGRQVAFRRRLPDLCPAGRTPKLNNKLHDWWEMENFASLRDAVKSHFKTDIPLAERSQWEDWFNAERAEIGRLSAEIERDEAEISAIVCRLFALTSQEMALL